jgi:hypothetical protein
MKLFPTTEKTSNMSFVRFEIFTAVTMKIGVFWDVTPCAPVRTFNGQFYGQTDGVAMGSPLSPVIANFYMEDYEKETFGSAPLKPRCWFRYVDDTFVIW